MQDEVQAAACNYAARMTAHISDPNDRMVIALCLAESRSEVTRQAAPELWRVRERARRRRRRPQ